MGLKATERLDRPLRSRFAEQVLVDGALGRTWAGFQVNT